MPDTDLSAAPPDSLRRRPARRWLPIGLGVVGFLLLAAASLLPSVLSRPATVESLLQWALPEINGDFTVDSARIGWLPPLVVEGITLETRDGTPRPLAIKRIEGSRGLLGMLLGLGDFGRLRIEGVQLDVAFNEQEQSNLTGLFPPRPADPPPSGSEPRPRRSPVSLEVDIVDALITIDGPWAESSWQSDPVNVRLALGPDESGRSVWTIGRIDLLREAKLDPIVAEGVLAYAAPVLANATVLQGRFSLLIDRAKLPVGDPQGGELSGELVMHEVDLGPGPLVRRLLASLPGDRPQPGSVRISEDSHIRFALADRRISHEGLQFGIPLRQPGRRLDVRSSGSVGLADGSLALRLALPLPDEMPENRPLLEALAGKQLGLSIGGTLDAPRIDVDGTLEATARELLGLPAKPVTRPQEEPAKLAAEKPGKPGGEPETASDESTTGIGGMIADEVKRKLPDEARGDPTAEAIVDLVGGVLDEVAKRRAERKRAEAENPPDGNQETVSPERGEDPRPRRGRLLERLRDRIGNPPPAAPADDGAKGEAAGGEAAGGA